MIYYKTWHKEQFGVGEGGACPHFVSHHVVCGFRTLLYNSTCNKCVISRFFLMHVRNYQIELFKQFFFI